MFQTTDQTSSFWGYHGFRVFPTVEKYLTGLLFGGKSWCIVVSKNKGSILYIQVGKKIEPFHEETDGTVMVIY